MFQRYGLHAVGTWIAAAALQVASACRLTGFVTHLKPRSRKLNLGHEVKESLRGYSHSGGLNCFLSAEQKLSSRFKEQELSITEEEINHNA
jgi:hypothetical protein